MNLKKFIDKSVKDIDNLLEKYLVNTAAPARLIEAMKYSVFAGGKRLRPLLVLSSAYTFGGKESYKNALPAAAAIEMTHTYSLIHDDLPCMDNDDYRRGKLTNHKVFGENIAVLAGDALLTHAFAVITKYSPAQYSTLLVKTLADAAGINGMLAGQTLDILHENQQITDINKIIEIHKFKTGALITASLKLGAICAELDDKHLKRLSNFGDKLGLAFQIVDDILDITSTFEKLGKPINSDTEKNKSTFPKILGVEQSKKYAEDLYQSALKELSKFSEKFDISLLQSLAEKLVNREN